MHTRVTRQNPDEFQAHGPISMNVKTVVGKEKETNLADTLLTNIHRKLLTYRFL